MVSSLDDLGRIEFLFTRPDVHDLVYVFEEPYDHLSTELNNLVPYGQDAHYQRWTKCHTIHVLIQPQEESRGQLYVLKRANVPHYSEDITMTLFHALCFYERNKSTGLLFHFYSPSYNYSNSFMIVRNSDVEELAEWPEFQGELWSLLRIHGSKKGNNSMESFLC